MVVWTLAEMSPQDFQSVGPWIAYFFAGLVGLAIWHAVMRSAVRSGTLDALRKHAREQAGRARGSARLTLLALLAAAGLIGTAAFAGEAKTLEQRVAELEARVAALEVALGRAAADVATEQRDQPVDASMRIRFDRFEGITRVEVPSAPLEPRDANGGALRLAVALSYQGDQAARSPLPFAATLVVSDGGRVRKAQWLFDGEPGDALVQNAEPLADNAWSSVDAPDHALALLLALAASTSIEGRTADGREFVLPEVTLAALRSVAEEYKKGLAVIRAAARAERDRVLAAEKAERDRVARDTRVVRSEAPPGLSIALDLGPGGQLLWPAGLMGTVSIDAAKPIESGRYVVIVRPAPVDGTAIPAQHFEGRLHGNQGGDEQLEFVYDWKNGSDRNVPVARLLRLLKKVDLRQAVISIHLLELEFEDGAERRWDDPRKAAGR